MAPAPIRGYTKKDSSKLPYAKRISFLFKASLELAKRSPVYASYLGRKCLTEMENTQQRHGLSNAEISQLCRKCGCPVSHQPAEVVPLSKATVRRSQRRASKGPAGSVTMHAGVRRVCPVCKNNVTQKYPTKAIAEEKMNKVTDRRIKK